MLGKRIKFFREQCGVSQEEIAHRIGVHVNTIARWERDETTPRGTSLWKLANALGTTADHLLDGDQETPDQEAQNLPASNVSHVDIMQVPVIGNVKACCGNGNAYATDVEWDIIGYYPVPKSYLVGYSWQVGDNGFRCMRIEGDSMEPRLHEDDLILFASLELRNGEFGLVKYSDRLLVRGVLFEGKKNVRLRALNKDYRDIVVNLDNDEPEFGIVGKVLLVLPQPQTLGGGVL